MELTPLEQRIIANIREGDLITIDTLYRLGDLLKLADKKTIKEVAFNLVKKGVMIRIKRGKYLAVKSPEDYDPLKIANYLFDGYIAITTALFIYGYNQTKSFVIFGTTTSRKRSTKIGEYLYIAIPMGKLTFGSTYYRGYKVSTKAKTLLDCIYNMHYIADFVPLFDMIRDMTDENFSELLIYLSGIRNSSVIQRLGFILEKAGAPENIIEAILRKKGKSIVRLDSKVDKNINYDKMWGVFDNINLNRFKN